MPAHKDNMRNSTQRGKTRVRAGDKVIYEGDWTDDLYNHIDRYQTKTGKTVRVESITGQLWFEIHF